MIKLKSLKEPVDEELDGFRVAITPSLYPYTLPKMQKAEKKKYDECWLELAPTKELKDAYIKFKTIDWDEYVKRFTFEIKNNPKALKALEKLNHYIIIIIVKLLHIYVIAKTRTIAINL